MGRLLSQFIWTTHERHQNCVWIVFFPWPLPELFCKITVLQYIAVFLKYFFQSIFNKSIRLHSTVLWKIKPYRSIPDNSAKVFTTLFWKSIYVSSKIFPLIRKPKFPKNEDFLPPGKHAYVCVLWSQKQR